MLGKVLAGSVPVIAILVAAAFLTPPDFPLLARQMLLCAVGVGGMVLAERLLFGPGPRRVARALGLVVPTARAVIVALIVSLPMWLFLPVYGWATGTTVGLNREWLPILIGVVLVNGIAEEVIHRAFVFGHLRRTLTFGRAALTSALVFAGQHVYLVFTIGAVAGSASVVLALLLAFPFALLYERGGNSIGAPAILHTSSNAPVMLFVVDEIGGSVLLQHMGVVLVSMYLCFAFLPWLRDWQGTNSVRAAR